jgi:hypothetical protein
MLAILHLLVMFVADIFKSRRRLEAENLFLRHQLNIALRRAPPRLRLHGSDRALSVWMTRIWPTLARCIPGRKAGDYLAMASLWLQSVLALEIPK